MTIFAISEEKTDYILLSQMTCRAFKGITSVNSNLTLHRITFSTQADVWMLENMQLL